MTQSGTISTFALNLEGLLTDIDIRTIEREHCIETSRLDSFFKSHLIEPELIRSNNFKDFVSSRAGLILNLIEDATGKQISGRDSGEVRRAFEGASLNR